jgi:uncharacterized membrane protein YgcG
MLGTLLVAGCGSEQDGALPAADQGQRQPAIPLDQGGRIVDLAGALDPAEKLALGRRLALQQQADGRAVMVIILKAENGQSLEQVGWAVSGSGGATSPLLILIDPTSRQVRLEGDLRLEHRAAVAAAMRDDLAAGRLRAAIDGGLSRLEQLAP